MEREREREREREKWIIFARTTSQIIKYNKIVAITKPKRV